MIEAKGGALSLKSGEYKFEKMCMEPTSFTVKEESQFKGGEEEFVPTKLMTRLTYTLDEVRYLPLTIIAFDLILFPYSTITGFILPTYCNYYG